MTKSERWILSEFQVAHDRILHHNEKLIAHRERTPFAEVDLVLRSPNGFTVIEVKTSRGDLWASTVLKREQARRLYNARSYFEARYACDRVQLQLAVVSHDDEINPRACLHPTIEYFDIDNWT